MKEMYVIMHGDRKTACIDICLIGNTDRHWRNWGLLIDNRTNRPVSLHPLVDFNQAFHPCDDVEGANCQTVLPERISQGEAAARAVSKIGLNLISENEEKWFERRMEDCRILMERINILQAVLDS